MIRTFPYNIKEIYKLGREIKVGRVSAKEIDCMLKNNLFASRILFIYEMFLCDF